VSSAKRKPELWKSIPSCWFDFQDIYDEAVDTAPPGTILVEVGAFWGQSAVYLAEAAKLADKGLKVYCVDTFTMWPETNVGVHDPAVNPGIEPRVHAQFHNSQFETFAHFVDSTRLSPDPLRVLRMGSLEAAELLEGQAGNVHLVFLDDDHEYEHVRAELAIWTPLLRPGGIIAGHDFTEEFDGVRRAVREFFSNTDAGWAGFKEACGRSWVAYNV
jgi:cephalosporin hydroxylase